MRNLLKGQSIWKVENHWENFIQVNCIIDIEPSSERLVKRSGNYVLGEL